MSRINDALKKVRQAPPPRNAPSGLPTYQPPIAKTAPGMAWLVPAIVMVLVVAAIFFIGWALTHRSAPAVAIAPEPAKVAPTVPATPQVVAVSAPAIIKPQPVQAQTQPGNATNATNTRVSAKAVPASPPPLPKLQGIFYSSTAPSAIINGKSIHPGDQYQQYRVKMISKNTVTLIGPDKKEIQIGMGN